jgi:hypothetical protein
VINGIQTMSARTSCVLTELENGSGIADILRISPQAGDMDSIIHQIDALRRGEATADAAAEDLAGYATGGLCDGYWLGEAGMTNAR